MANLVGATVQIPLIVLISCVIAASIHPVFATQSQTGVMIPLYMPPGDGWNEVIQAKTDHPTVPMLVIINPSNGSGQTPSQDYAAGIQSLQSHGIAVFGYTYTEYASRNSTAVEQEIANYKNWYNVDGIFFDQMSSIAENAGYYENLTSYSRSLGMHTVGNAGIDISPSCIGSVDNIVIHDNETLPAIQYLGGWHTSYDKGNFSTLSFGVPTLDYSFVSNAKSYVGYIGITDMDLPNPWGGLPSYFAATVAALDTSQNATSSDPIVTVISVDSSGREFKGIWSELHLPQGTIINQGYTPRSYPLEYGKQYMLNATSWQNIVFDHWGDGSTDPYRAISPTQDTVLTAYYTGINGTSTAKTLTVKAVDMSGNPIAGMWTELHQPTGQTISSGYSPRSYAVTAGKSYVAFVSDWQGIVFDHWDDGSTDPYRAISPTQDTVLTAYYRQ